MEHRAGPRNRSAVSSVAILALMCVLAISGQGCGGDDASSTAAPTSAARSDPSSTRPSSDAEEGISRTEAESKGVLTGQYDATVSDPALESDGSAVLTLKNVGSSPDSYTITVESGGQVDRSTVSLDPGSTQELVVTGHSSSSELVVVSRGRNAEVVRVPVA